MFRYMDQYIFDLSKPHVIHIQLIQSILACNLVVNQSYLVGKHKQPLHLRIGKQNSIRLKIEIFQ